MQPASDSPPQPTQINHFQIIGWKETVDFPDWGIRNVVAKSDTGAKSSALDAKNIKESAPGQIQFDLVFDRRHSPRSKTIITPIVAQKSVRSSNGRVSQRYFVRTRVRIGSMEKPVTFSLSRRPSMVCRVLLGRTALEGDFLVDSSRKYETGPKLKAIAEDFEI